MAFESGAVTEGRRSAVIIPLYKGKGRGLNVRIIETLTYKCGWKNICRNIRGQSPQSD